jgi:Apea-like HEPN
MNFLTTSYVYPLPEKIILSRQLNFSLDNPRTPDEISTVKDYLLEAYELEQKKRSLFHAHRPIEDYERILFEFRDAFSGENTYIAKFFDSYEREDIFEFIASMWVIARFDDEGETQFIKEELAKLSHLGEYHALLEEDSPIVRNSARLISYSYLLSLLAHSEDDYYFGRCFVPEPNQGIQGEPVEKLWRDFLTLETVVQSDLQDEENEPLRWMFLPSALDDLQKTTQLLEKAFDEGQTEKLLYIGGILKVASYDTKDVKIAVVMLTSIIELLLTHSPNASRFNVEDSISKQFQLKASILIYLNNKAEDINHIKKRLKTIYEQRSNIAHGNFGELHKYIGKLSKKEGEEEGVEDLKSDLYKYIRIILEEYLKDRGLVDFLKEN